MSDLVCYLCGSTDEVELDDALGILPVEKPICCECWFHSDAIGVADRVLRPIADGGDEHATAERVIRDLLDPAADGHDWSLSND